MPKMWMMACLREFGTGESLESLWERWEVLGEREGKRERGEGDRGREPSLLRSRQNSFVR